MAKKKKEKRCATPKCKRKSTRTFCSTCRSRKCRAANPIRAAFINVRNRARRDGIPFTLTLEEFESFCYRTQYHIKKGRTIEGYNIDRDDEEQGYHAWNIRIRPKPENVRKYYDWVRQKAATSEDLRTPKQIIDEQRQLRELRRKQNEEKDYF